MLQHDHYFPVPVKLLVLFSYSKVYVLIVKKTIRNLSHCMWAVMAQWLKMESLLDPLSKGLKSSLCSTVTGS